jgi:TM2 domain-containing membrane protein YozV
MKNSFRSITILSMLLILLGVNSLYAAVGSNQQKIEVNYSAEHSIGKVSKKKSLPPHDYGDRSKLSAFILCAMLGFTGAHHFYMKHYFSGALQLSFFLLSSVLSVFGIAIFLSGLFSLALGAWVAADLLLIIFDGLRLKKGKKLIPFEQSI